MRLRLIELRQTKRKSVRAHMRRGTAADTRRRTERAVGRRLATSRHIAGHDGAEIRKARCRVGRRNPIGSAGVRAAGAGEGRCWRWFLSRKQRVGRGSLGEIVAPDRRQHRLRPLRRKKTLPVRQRWKAKRLGTWRRGALRKTTTERCRRGGRRRCSGIGRRRRRSIRRSRRFHGTVRHGWRRRTVSPRLWRQPGLGLWRRARGVRRIRLVEKIGKILIERQQTLRPVRSRNSRPPGREAVAERPVQPILKRGRCFQRRRGSVTRDHGRRSLRHRVESGLRRSVRLLGNVLADRRQDFVDTELARLVRSIHTPPVQPIGARAASCESLARGWTRAIPRN